MMPADPDQVHGIVFACARDGLARTLEQDLLGGYDGTGAWVLAVRNLRGDSEQLMVEAHEGLHHELQTSSGLGLVSAMALSLAKRGYRPYALAEFFHGLANDSTTTHEVFATTLSASIVGTGEAKAMLADNPVYLSYLERGLALGARGRHRQTVAAAVLRCCMAPAGVLDLLDDGFGRISRSGLSVRGGLPDQRLAAFEAVGLQAGWPELVTELPVGLDEDSLPRWCYEQVCQVLDSAGLPSVSWAEQEQVAVAIKDAVARVDAELAERLNVVTDRRPIWDDGLDFDRQKLVLRERLPAEIIDLQASLPSIPAFVTSDDGPPHACGVWLSRRVVEKQFAIPDGVRLPDVLCGLLTRASDGAETVRFGLMPESTTPRDLQNLVGDTPLLVLTTHYTLNNDAVAGTLGRVRPVFVLMDLPVTWHVEYWIGQGATVSMALTPLENVTGKLLLAAFTVDRSPGFRFLSVGGEAGVSILVERLRRRHGDKLIISGDVLRDVVTNLNLILGHIFACWHSLDQDAVE
jgi:hypothetical protein